VIAALTAGILMLLQMLLMAAVIVTRWRVRQSLGDGGNAQLTRAIRRHGNLAENAPLFIAGLALLEILGGGRTLLEILAGVFVLGRLCHAAGLSMKRSVNPLRTLGIVGTIGPFVELGWRLVAMGLRGLNG
jgi:uncharacterized membrane protein YecN with MAPEG domain